MQPVQKRPIKNGDSAEKLKPTKSVDIEKLVPDEDFAGDYKNDDYSAHIEKNDECEMVITISSEAKDGIGYEWVIKGFFGDETYRINYTDAEKFKISYNSSGAEKAVKPNMRTAQEE